MFDRDKSKVNPVDKFIAREQENHMTVVERHTGGDNVRLMLDDPILQMHAKFKSSSIKKAETLVIMGTVFGFQGKDFCKFTLFDAKGRILESVKSEGY